MAGKWWPLIFIVPKYMLNLDKLNSQLDLNNLDIGKIIKLISEHQNTFIKIVLVVGTLFLAVMMFNDHRVKDQGIRTKIDALQQKLSVIKSRDQAVLDLNALNPLCQKRSMNMN